MTIEDIKTILNDIRDEIQLEYRAEILGIFGSYARGEESNDSDIDILVRFSDEATLFDLVGLGNFLEERLGTKVDIVSERALRKEIEKEVFEEIVRL